MPGAGPKRKGNGFEREVVKQAEGFGLKASRSWASDGRSRGMAKEVDLLIEQWKVQCKRIKALPKWLGLIEGIDLAVTREDNGEAYAVLRLETFLALISQSDNATAGPEKSKVKS